MQELNVSEGADGTRVACLGAVPAGTTLSGLTAAFIDDSGRPAQPGFKGTVPRP